jgi:putative tryptophan/tyrosine transport system substrate-binding protein
MRRREFLAGVAGAGAAWPQAGRAQPAKPSLIGVLVLGNPPPEPFLEALREGLREVGYIEGRNLRVEVRNGEGRASGLPEKAAELVALNVDLIVAYQTPCAVAAKQATTEVPIVFSSVGDPLGTGLVASVARPGTNATGTTAGTAEVAGKSVELVRELIPSARRLAVLANAVDPFTQPYLNEIGSRARGLGMELDPVMVRPAEPFEAAFAAMSDRGAAAAIVQGSLVRNDAAALALKHRLPSLASPSIWPRSGGLLSYAADFHAMLRDTAGYVERILKGARAADLPVSFPSKFELIVNLKTAKAIGLTIPPNILSRADEVIE